MRRWQRRKHLSKHPVVSRTNSYDAAASPSAESSSPHSKDLATTSSMEFAVMDKNHVIHRNQMERKQQNIVLDVEDYEKDEENTTK